jgi:hypothetical protein
LRLLIRRDGGWAPELPMKPTPWSRAARRAALAAAIGLQLGIAYLHLASALSPAVPSQALVEVSP